MLFLAGLFVYVSMGKDSEYDLKLVAWNIESGGNDPKVIAEQLKDFSDHHVVALNEVKRSRACQWDYRTKERCQFSRMLFRTVFEDRRIVAATSAVTANAIPKMTSLTIFAASTAPTGVM